MRLIRLRIRNIASLRGEHEVNFQKIQEESPLFAITGETGSGKSTILNCIGLALYGQIYKKNVTQPDVVTLGEKEGSVELIFQVKGKYYLADWKIRVRKQNGEPYSTPQSAIRNLYNIEGTEFSSAKNISTTNVTELLNLDFDQFCKCIILNQGEFAKFLTSSFNDRKEILEKLYPGELLDNISKELDQEKKALEKSKNELEIELHTLRGDNQSGEDLKEEKARLAHTLAIHEENLKKFEAIDYHFVSLFSYFKKYGENEKRKSQIKHEMTLETSKYNLLMKEGEEIYTRYQELKQRQEKEVPILQVYLEKESTLKHLEESALLQNKKVTDLTHQIHEVDQKISLKEIEENTLKHKLGDLKSKLTLPIEEMRKVRDHFSELFDLFSEKEVLQEELRGKNERLTELEGFGKDLKTQVEKIQLTITSLPQNAVEEEAILQEKKTNLQKKIDQKQRALIASQELSKQIELLTKKIEISTEKISTIRLVSQKLKDEILPLEATLKLQEVLNATEVCVNHALKSQTDVCPVCESSVPASRWENIKAKLNATDLASIRKKFEAGDKEIFQNEREIESLRQIIQSSEQELTAKNKEKENLEAALKEELPELSQLDLELDSIRKKALELSHLRKDFDSKSQDLQKIRMQFKLLRDEITEREKSSQTKEEKLQGLAQKLSAIVPVINRDSIRDLKAEVKNFSAYESEEGQLEKLLHEKRYLTERKTDGFRELQAIKTTLEEQTLKITEIKDDLTQALKGERASVLIQRINNEVKTISESWSKHSEEQKKKELVLKDSQGRLYSLDELTKDIDLQFAKELFAVKDLASFRTQDQETDILLEKLSLLDLGFSSPIELFIPLEDHIKAEKVRFKKATDETRMLFAGVSEKLSAWEKLQDKIQLLELKARDINEALERKLRLFEVLGKDELRTFVLSLVEEGLIQQTNEELQKLCQGRYEIVHQTKSMKMTPEFFILDKFREGGRRKVSTLSGGETFMVSIAMALGLAEMTRGQAEIDSLFIDEGFGTLDQDSLEDVLDMLQQIQTRGLMVGIISHIKSLTTALPVNLLLTKKSEGTSSISIQRN